jgi:hypothetical protein
MVFIVSVERVATSPVTLLIDCASRLVQRCVDVVLGRSMYHRPWRMFKCVLLFSCLTVVVYRITSFAFDQREGEGSRGSRSLETHETARQDTTMLNGSSNVFEESRMTLDPFYVRFPNFFDDESKQWFHNSTYYKIHSRKCPHGVCDERGILFDDANEHLSVRVAAVPDGLYLNDDCGYNYGDEPMRRRFRASDKLDVIYDQAIVYTVPDGWSFQHFLDGVGPKLSHSRSYLHRFPDAKVIVLRGPRFDRSVKEIWSMLGESSEERRTMNVSQRICSLSRSGRIEAHRSLHAREETRRPSPDQSVSYGWDSSVAVAQRSSHVLVHCWPCQSTREADGTTKLHLHSTYVEQRNERRSSHPERARVRRLAASILFGSFVELRRIRSFQGHETHSLPNRTVLRRSIHHRRSQRSVVQHEFRSGRNERDRNYALSTREQFIADDVFNVPARESQSVRRLHPVHTVSAAQSNLLDRARARQCARQSQSGSRTNANTARSSVRRTTSCRSLCFRSSFRCPTATRRVALTLL